MRQYWDLKNVTFAAGANSGGDLKLSQVPATVDGQENYVTGIEFRLVGNMTADGTGYNLNKGEVCALLQRVLLEVPGLRPFINNVRGIDLARLHKMRNKGDDVPGADAQTVGTGATQAVDFTLPVQFGDPNARKFTDCHIPARLLKDANLLVNFESLANINAHLSSVSLTLKTTVITTPRPEVVMPALWTLEGHDYAANEVQPNIPKSTGKVSHLLIGKQRAAGQNNGFPTTDFNTLGVRFGSRQVSQDSLSPAAFYGQFNEWATTDYTSHVANTGKIDEGIPLVFPPIGMNGQHATYEMVDARGEWRLKADVAANAYTLVRRELWTPGPWQDTVRQRLNLPASATFKPQTASKKGTAPGAIAGLPLKQVG